MKTFASRFFCGLLPAMVMAGCQRYQPMPLTPAAVDRAIAAPDPTMWQAKVADLKHPLLKPVPIDLRNGLTPDAAAIVAVITNPGLRSQRARRSLASAQLLQAGLLPNPSLDFTLDPVTGGNTQGAVTAYNVGVSWELTALISHDAKVAAARAQSKSVELDIAWQEWQFAQAARKAVFDLVALDAQSTEAQAVDQRLGENLNLIRQAVEQRARTILDLAAAEAASQKAHADFLATQRDLHHQRLMLNQSLGLDPDATVRIASIMLPSKLDVPSIQELTSGAENNRLDLQALRLGYQSQEQTLRAAVLAQFPKIVLGVHQARDNTNVISTGFGVAIDLPIFDQNQGNIATQRATRQQLFDEYASRIFESRATIAQVIDDIHSLTEQIAAAEAAIPSLQRLVQTYEAAVGQHNADVLSYYLAWNDLSQKRIDLLKLKQQLIDNQMALEIASGRYLPTPIAPAPASGPTTRETLP